MHLKVSDPLPLTLEGWPSARIRLRVDEVLELVELPGDVGDRRPARWTRSRATACSNPCSSSGSGWDSRPSSSRTT